MFKKTQRKNDKRTRKIMIIEYLKLSIKLLAIAYAYTGIMYAKESNFNLSITPIIAYLAIFILILFLIVILNKINPYKHLNVSYPDITKLIACHEAGHFIVAKALELPIREVSILVDGNKGGELILDMPPVLRASEIKKLALVSYAGFLSEKILLGEASDGCMGTKHSDMQSANDFLRDYIVLTDDSLSLTGYEEELVKNKCIKLSNIWRKEVEEILIKNKSEVSKITEQLIIEKIIRVA